MNNTMKKLLSLLLVAVMTVCLLAACGGEKKPEQPTQPTLEHIDYAVAQPLDMNSSTKKLEVKFGDRSQIDGDTTHFEVSTSVDSSGKIKARYLAVDTPESTGQIEEWGKAASRYTQETLSSAYSIMIESDTDQWNFDGNGRYLLWIWYQPEMGTEYRNLNIELLQNGLGASSSAHEGRYGANAVAAINQAKQEKLYMWSGEKDPDFPYGEAASVTLRELRMNAADYEGQKVAVEGLITYNSDYTAFIQSYDSETEMWYGMQVFYGYNSRLIPVLEQGAMVRVVGVVNSFYGTYQISGLTYNPMKPEDPANTSQISKGNEVPFPETSPTDFNSEKTVMIGDEEKSFRYCEMAVSTSISMKNLKVTKVYTTTNPDSDDCGAMTLTCKAGGQTISVRTEVLKDADGNLITADAYKDKTINVEGVVDHFEGKYQIRVYTKDDIEIVG